MPRSHNAYPLEFSQQMVDLASAGRTPGELSREFEPIPEWIRNWVRPADLDTGNQTDGLTSDEPTLIRPGALEK